MTIENPVLSIFDDFDDSINVFDCDKEKCTAFVSVRAIILTYAYDTSKVLAIKKPSFIGSFMYMRTLSFYALSKSNTSGKGNV